MWITQYPQYPVCRFSVADSGWRFPQKQETLPPSIRPAQRPTKLITQARCSKEYRHCCSGYCLCLCSKSTESCHTGSQKDHNILPRGVGVPLCHCLAGDRRLKIPRSSLHYNQHSPLTLASACFRYHQHTSPHVFCCSVHVDISYACLITIRKPWHRGNKHLHCRQSRPEFSDLRQPLTRQLKTLILSLPGTISHCPRHRKVAQMNHICHIIIVKCTIKYMLHILLFEQSFI